MAFSLMLYFTALLLTPYTFWFEYEEVVPVQMQFEQGEPLLFYSIAQIHRTSDLRWNDVLRCDIGHGYGHFSNYESSATVDKREFGEGGAWAYQAVRPVPPAKCFLESHITVDLDFGISKTQTVIGRSFEIID